MKPLHIFLMMTLALAFLSGCRSSKGGTKGNSYGNNAGGMTNYAVDYSKEETDAMGRDLASEARRWLGTPYRYGGRDRSGTDCSGLVMELYRTVCAMKLPRTTVEQKSYCTEVARNKARVGDLVFFGSGKGAGSVSHVGLYIGQGEMIHASSSRGVMVSRVDAGYWGDRFRSIGRVDGAYDSWASTDRGKASKKNEGKSKNKDKQRGPAPFEVPAPLPSAAGQLPVPVAEIAYDKLPSRSASPASSEAVTGGQTDEMAIAAVAGRTSDAASAKNGSAQVAPVDSDPVASIDLLDLIINQKADSIFSDRFMD